MTTTLPATQKPHSLFPEFSDFFSAFPSFAGIRPMLDTRLMRLEDEMVDGRSEFSYGSFVRTVSLPSSANEDDIKATYDKGILTASVAVSEPAPAEKHVKVATK